MKKGFTLIELLAVILILGIIVLIAIPTVNNIISEARYGAFKSGNENIMKQVEQKCQTDLIKGKMPVLSYLFTDGESSNKIDAKGSLPNDGYILLNKECEVTNYYLTDNKNIYSNNEDIRQDYMLKAPKNNSASIFKELYSSYYLNIKNIYFINNLNIPNNAIEIKDPSVSEKEKIKSWLVQSGEKYDLYVGSEGTIYANYNSSSLFKDLENVITINLNNFDTSLTTNMQLLFNNDFLLEEADVSKFNTSNVTDMNGMFYECRSIKNINVVNFNTSNVTNMSSLFRRTTSITELDVSSWDTSNVTNMYGLFSNGALSNSELTSIRGLENWDTSKVTTMHYMFYYRTKLTDINVSNFNTKNVLNFDQLFENCKALNNLNLSKWIFSPDSTKNRMFYDCISLDKISLSNSNINFISEVLISRVNKTPGYITIIDDKTGLDLTTLNSKNWNVI